MGLILFLVVVLGLAYRAMSPEERVRALQLVRATVQRQKDKAVLAHRACEPFREALRSRTRWAPLTPAVAVLNVTIFIFLLLGTGAVNDPATFVAWGGSIGPRTTNGEWWRLLTALSVHGSILHLIVNVVALVHVGLVLERLLGRPAFAFVYVAAGICAGLVSLAGDPLSLSIGSSGAIFGLYGLLIASAIWGSFQRSNASVPPVVLRQIAVSAAVFVLYNVARGQVMADIAGFFAGFASGLVLAKDVGRGAPSARVVGGALAATAVIIVISAAPLRGIVDARPEIARVVALEDRTARVYEKAVDAFKKGRMTAESLAQLIDRTIVPELQAADVRLKALHRLPREHEPLVANAEEYLHKRGESWRLRSEGLRTLVSARDSDRSGPPSDSARWRAERRHGASMLALGKAEGAERASLEALKRARPSEQK